MVFGYQGKVHSDVIARSMMYDGRPVTVTHVQYSEDYFGMGKESFAVHVGGDGNNPEQNFGFASQDDVNRFLTSWDEQEFDSHTSNGQPTKETRQGLGLADAMVSRVPSKASTSPTDTKTPPKGNA